MTRNIKSQIVQTQVELTALLRLQSILRPQRDLLSVRELQEEIQELHRELQEEFRELDEARIRERGSGRWGGLA